MGQIIELLLNRCGMVECRPSSHFHFVGEETDSAIIRYGFTTGPDSAGDLVQALPAEAGCALCNGEWVCGETTTFKELVCTKKQLTSPQSQYLLETAKGGVPGNCYHENSGTAVQGGRAGTHHDSHA